MKSVAGEKTVLTGRVEASITRGHECELKASTEGKEVQGLQSPTMRKKWMLSVQKDR